MFSFAALWRWSFVGLLFAAKSVLLTVTVESGLHHVTLGACIESSGDSRMSECLK